MRSRLPFLAALALAACDAVAEPPDPGAAGPEWTPPVDGRVLARQTTFTARGPVTSVKYLDRAGVIRGARFDRAGQAMDQRPIPARAGVSLGDELAAVLAAGGAPDAPLTLDLALADDLPSDEPPLSGSGLFRRDASLAATPLLDGTPATEADHQRAIVAKLARLQAQAAVRRDLRAASLRELSARESWDMSAEEIEELADGLGAVVRTIPRGRVAGLLRDNAHLLSAVELHQATEDGTLATAMAATRVKPGAVDQPDSVGQGIGIYMTESGCAPTAFITGFKRLAGSDTTHSRAVASILRSVSPASFVYCRAPAALPSSSDLAGSGGNPRVHIVTTSNGGGTGDYTSNDRDWDNFVYNTAVPAFVMAGNLGNTNGNLLSPGKALNVVTVGNYRDATMTIHETSSWRDPPNTKNRKPEISAPGTNINVAGDIWTGTSFSTPHAAGMGADYTDAFSWVVLRPYMMKALMLAGARDTIAGGVDKVGLGGADYMSGYRDSVRSFWEGNNAAFDTFDAQDIFPNNGAVEFPFSASAGARVRVVLTWLNRGTYTYDHRAEAHPIGMDLDLTVWGPGDSYIASSISWDDPFESIDFVPSVSGTYRVMIVRTFNRDPSSKLNMGVVIDAE